LKKIFFFNFLKINFFGWFFFFKNLGVNPIKFGENNQKFKKFPREICPRSQGKNKNGGLSKFAKKKQNLK